jgi:hypothetical protein
MRMVSLVEGLGLHAHLLWQTRGKLRQLNLVVDGWTHMQAALEESSRTEVLEDADDAEGHPVSSIGAIVPADGSSPWLAPATGPNNIDADAADADTDALDGVEPLGEDIPPLELPSLMVNSSTSIYLQLLMPVSQLTRSYFTFDHDYDRSLLTWSTLAKPQWDSVEFRAFRQPHELSIVPAADPLKLLVALLHAFLLVHPLEPCRYRIYQ